MTLSCQVVCLTISRRMCLRARGKACQDNAIRRGVLQCDMLARWRSTCDSATKEQEKYPTNAHAIVLEQANPCTTPIASLGPLAAAVAAAVPAVQLMAGSAAAGGLGSSAAAAAVCT
jgi:hypothetical protein